MLPFERLYKSNTIDNLWLYILSLAQKTPTKFPKILRKNLDLNQGKLLLIEFSINLSMKVLLKVN